MLKHASEWTRKHRAGVDEGNDDDRGGNGERPVAGESSGPSRPSDILVH